MIFLMQDNMASRLKVPSANGGEQTIKVIEEREGVISFSDFSYQNLVGTMKYFEMDYKVVLPMAEDQMYAAIMSETDSSLLINYEDFIIHRNNNRHTEKDIEEYKEEENGKDFSEESILQ